MAVQQQIVQSATVGKRNSAREVWQKERNIFDLMTGCIEYIKKYTCITYLTYILYFGNILEILDASSIRETHLL